MSAPAIPHAGADPFALAQAAERLSMGEAFGIGLVLILIALAIALWGEFS